LRRFRAARERDPLLVVPTRDDVELFERELAVDGTASLGGSVTTMPRLAAEAARTAGVEHGASLTRLQRIWIAREAARSTDLKALGPSARALGFAVALESMVSELRATGIDPPTLATRAEELGGSHERDLARHFDAWETLRAKLGRDDGHSIAAAATSGLRANEAAWGARPVFLYGFDELSAEQLELLRALARGTDVTVAVAYEDRAAMTARAALLSRLRDELGAEVEVELASERGNTASEALYHLERSLFEPRAERREPDHGIALLAAGGEQEEIELIGAEVASLLAAEVPADEIAIATRDPARRGAAIGQALSGLGIPAAVEARLPLARTGTGTALTAALRCALPGGTAADLVAYLRLAGGPHPHQIDWLERAIRRRRLASAEDALTDWEESSRGHPIDSIERLREAAGGEGLLGALGEEANRIAQRRHYRRAPRPDATEQLELRAGATASAALAELAELTGLEPRADELADALSLVSVPLWEGTVEGRVRVLSPSRLRASRPRYVFCASLQDGEFPGAGALDPLLSDERRAALGLPARASPADEERYLFYVCASRAAERLYLSYHEGDDGGRALTRSAFVDEVRDLLDPAPSDQIDPLEEEITTRRAASEVTFAPDRAPTERELTRSLATLRRRAPIEEAIAGLTLPAEVAERARARLERARPAATLPGPLAEEHVLAALAERRLFGASSIEEHHRCTYRWFVNHELSPQRIDPDPDALSQGGVLHAVLERLYADPPGTEGLASANSISAWQEQAQELIKSELIERGLDPQSATYRMWLSRLAALLDRFLSREAEAESPLQPDAALLEASFGEGEDDDRGPVDLGGWLLHGRIDRVDVTGDGRALIRDYKLSSKVPSAKRMIDEGGLQLPLYALALREGWGLEPIGALYHPLGATKEPRPRGPIASEAKDELVASDGHFRTDFLDEEKFEAVLEEARMVAGTRVELMRAGQIDRDPRDDKCPNWCRFQSICRIERAAPEDLDEDDQA
jgi:ATP-dependent helicase/DNAse subunit B